MSDALFDWCVDQLYHRFGLEACEDIVKYILSIEKAEELEEYVGDLLQGTDGKKRYFIDELIKRWEKTQKPSSDTAGLFFLKEPASSPELPDMAKESQKKSKRKGRNKQEGITYSPQEPEPEAVRTPIDLKRVCTREEQEILQRDSNKSQKLRKKLMGDGGERDYLPHQEARMKAGLEKAVQHKDKLLEFDRNSVKRTQVLDDESDYFATESNQWLLPSEREKLRKKEEELREIRHASRKDRKITLDFAGRQVLDRGDNLDGYYNKLDETLKAMNPNSLSKSQQFSGGQGDRQTLRDLVNPNIMQSAPEWVDVGGVEYHKRSMEQGKKVASGSEERSRLRLQDKELQEMSDGGWVLSMHQPWASLLVKGIKRVEGRTWYTSHRGRLWIAAAAKKPTAEEIAAVGKMYRHIYRKEPNFPKDYPTSCLLGCVNVTDCLSQEQFREQFPDICEESASPFVFICTNPQELLVKFPMKGKHKIWKMESHYHQGAKKGLRPSVVF